MKRQLNRFTTVLSISLLAGMITSCADWFQDKIPMTKRENFAYLTSLVVPEATISQLDPPAQIFVSQAESPNIIYISWSEVTGATSYYLERAVSKTKDIYGNFNLPDDGDWESVPLSRIYSTQYVDTIIQNPSYTSEEYEWGYFYRVSAENPRLKYENSEFKTSTAAGYLLAPPANVKASLGEFLDHIEISWKKSSGARSYDIYRSQNEDGSAPIRIGSVSANQTKFSNVISQNEQGKDFFYTVHAKSSNSSSVSSSIALGYSLLEGAPARVTGVKVINGRGNSGAAEINISWDTVGGSGMKYSVYRSTSKDSTLTLLQQGTESTTYKDQRSISPNVLYYYQVQAFKMEGEGDNATKVKGPFSSSGRDGSDPAEAYILSTPRDINVVKNRDNPSKANISLSPALGSRDCSEELAVKDYNDYSYRIYWSDIQDGAYNDVIGTYDASSLTLINGMYTITDIDTKKFYKITTINNSTGAESALSSVCAPVPFAARNVKPSRGEFIPSVTTREDAANSQGVFPVIIAWNPPEENDAAGGYNIYRSTRPDSGFKKINEEPLKSTSYLDSYDSSKAGTYYYYRVLSLNALGQGANYSDTEIGYGALSADQFMREYNKTIKKSLKRLTLMHKGGMDKLGSESVNGGISGSLSYSANTSTYGGSIGGDVDMKYTDYAEFYIQNDPTLGRYVICNGKSNTISNLSSGHMYDTVNVTGMYLGAVVYDNVQIVSQKAGGGYYIIKRQGFPDTNVDWLVGEE